MVHRYTLFLLAAVSALTAQTPDTATINGHAVDPSHAAIPGVQVTVRNTMTGLQRSAQTDASGSFSLSGLPAGGKYTVTATRQGFADAELNNVELAGGTTATITLQLNVAAGQTAVT